MLALSVMAVLAMGLLSHLERRTGSTLIKEISWLAMCQAMSSPYIPITDMRHVMINGEAHVLFSYPYYLSTHVDELKRGLQMKIYPNDLVNDLSQEERETHINYTAEDRRNNTASVYTDDPVVYREMIKKGHTPSKVTKGHAVFVIENRFVSIRKSSPKRKMSDEQKKAAALRLAAARESH